MEDFITVVFGLEGLVIGVGVYGIVQFLKSILDVAMGGRVTRRRNRVLTRIVLPALGPVVGALLAFIPFHPTLLVDMVADRSMGWPESQFVFSLWGATIGGFADYLYSKVSSFFQHD